MKFFMIILFALLMSTLALAQTSGKTYVLVHGAFQSKWNWDKVKALLEAQGNTVIAIDLPAHGADTTPPTEVTLESYRDAVIAAIGDRTDVILVGHSFGGMTVANVSEAIPDQLAKAVYVAAFLPQTGDSTFSLAQNPVNANSKVGMYIQQDDPEKPTVLFFKPEGLVELFCADCDAATQAQILANQQKEPILPQTQMVTLTEANFGSVPRYYVKTLKDMNVSPELQDYMLSRTPVEETFEMNTSHAPMLSMPEQLTEILLGM